MDSTEYVNHEEVSVGDIFMESDCEETIDSLNDSQCLKLLCKIGMWQIEQSMDVYDSLDKMKTRLNMLEYNLWQLLDFYCQMNGPFEVKHREGFDD